MTADEPVRRTRHAAADPAVDEDRTLPDEVQAPRQHPVDPRAVVVRQEDVVVLREETDRRREVGVGERAVLDVEELAAGVVAEGPQSGPQALHDLAQAGEPRPGPDVRGARRSEGPQVAQDEGIDRRRRRRPARPRLERRVHGPALPPPQAARRDLDQRQRVSRGVGERGRVAVRPARGQVLPEIARGHRSFFERGARRVEDRFGVEAIERLGERRIAERPAVDAGRERGDREGVLGGEQMEGRPQ